MELRGHRIPMAFSLLVWFAIWEVVGRLELVSLLEHEGRDPRVEWLYRQIAQLKDVDRSVALLLLDGFSYKEIAAIVGLSESNVGVKINRIKSALAGKRAEEATS